MLAFTYLSIVLIIHKQERTFFNKINNSMLFGIITLITALAIAGVAAWFSIAGLMVIFSASALPVAIMAGSLEIGKLVTASWLYRNWKQTKFLLKTYLSLSVFVLMFITSMGIFGYLSKAHIEQTATLSVDYSLEIDVIQGRIDAEQLKIDNFKSRLQGLDNVLMTSQDKDKNYVNRTQRDERQAINEGIDQSLINMQEYNQQLLPLKRDVAKVEAEIGPLKYIAELIYGNEAAKDHFDEAVRWIIIILVVVFDPLAVALLIAANQTLRNHGINIEPEDKPRGNKSSELDSKDPPNTPNTTARSSEATNHYNGSNAERSNVLQDSEPERDREDSLLLQQPRAVNNKSEINDQLTSLEATKEAQKKRSANSRKKSTTSKKKITANRKK